MSIFETAFNKAGELFGLDMGQVLVWALVVYAATQGLKKIKGVVGWKVVSLVILESIVVGLLLTCVHGGVILITLAAFSKALQYAVFVGVGALLVGTAIMIAPDRRPLLELGPGPTASQESSAVEAPTVEMPALASVLPIIRAPRQKTRFELGVHAFADAFFKGKNNA